MKLDYIDNIDCLEGLSAIPDKSVDLVVTDPPYGINTRSAMNTGSKLNPWADLCNASFWYTAWLRECQRVLKDDGALWCFINWRGFTTIQKAGLDMAWPIESLLIWDKCWIGPGGKKGLRPSYEMVALFTGPEFSIPDRSLPDIQRAKWSSLKPHGHPAEKPEELIRWIIRSSGKQDGAVILDPFMGSGTTACAAIREGCHYIGFEMDAEWKQKADARIEETLDALLIE
jgi:site-specific DNA-methyltransferase (adenine-specific)